MPKKSDNTTEELKLLKAVVRIYCEMTNALKKPSIDPDDIDAIVESMKIITPLNKKYRTAIEVKEMHVSPVKSRASSSKAQEIDTDEDKEGFWVPGQRKRIKRSRV
jgi:DNA repair ATPase RecN